MGPLPNSQQLLGIPGVLQGSLCLHRIQHSVVRAAALPAGNAVGTHPSLPQALQGSLGRKSCNSPFCSAIIQLYQRKDPQSAMSSVANQSPWKFPGWGRANHFVATIWRCTTPPDYKMRCRPLLFCYKMAIENLPMILCCQFDFTNFATK